MKKLCFLILLLTVSAGSRAQNPNNVNVNTQRFSWGFRMQPSDPRSPLFFDYGVRVEAVSGVRQIYDVPTLTGKFQIEGQRAIADVPVDGYLLTVSLPDIVVTSAAVEGDATVGYHMLIKYKYGPKVRFAAGDEVLDATRPTVDTFGSDISPEYAWTTKNSKTPAEAREFWQNNMPVLRGEILRGAVDMTIKQWNTHLSRRYGFFIGHNTLLEPLRAVKAGKHSEGDPLTDMISSTRKKLETLNGRTPLSEADLAAEIAYFKALPARYADTNPKNKADLKIRYVAYYNLAKIYLLIDQPRQAAEWAKLLIANGHEVREGEKIKETAEALERELAASITPSRQFDPEQLRK